MMDRRSLRERLRGSDSPERRAVAVSAFELRSDKANSLTLDGYASVFDEPYDVYGGPEAGGFMETIDSGAFDRTLREKPDLHLLINHEGLPLARTKSGTLTLSTDRHGLRVLAQLDRRDPDVQRLETKMGRGDMDEMSFAFRTKADKWSDDDTERRVTEASLHKGDVSVVNFGANPATTVGLRGLRGLVDEFAGLDIEDALVEARSMGPDALSGAVSVLRTLLAEAKPKGSLTLTLAQIRDLGDSTDLPAA